MKSIASKKSNGSKREYSPTEVKMLDDKGKEIVEILKEKGTIKPYPPIRHSPPLEPREISYPPNHRERRNYTPRINSPEIELENESVYVPKNMRGSPFKDKENITLNIDKNSKMPPNPQYYKSSSPNFEIPPPISFSEPQYPPQFAQSMPFNGYYPYYVPQEHYYQPMQSGKVSEYSNKMYLYLFYSKF